jgi:hypothetical protein
MAVTYEFCDYLGLHGLLAGTENVIIITRIRLLNRYTKRSHHSHR